METCCNKLIITLVHDMIVTGFCDINFLKVKLIKSKIGDKKGVALSANILLE